jgi:hypothetical protein
MKRDKSKFDRIPVEKDRKRSSKLFGPPEVVEEVAKPAPVEDFNPFAAKAKSAYVLEICTTLLFVSLRGEKREEKLTRRVMSYLELQRDIARYNKKSTKAFVILDADGHVIPDTPFLGYDLIRIKEIAFKPSPRELSELGSLWESEVYYVNNSESPLRNGRALDKSNVKKVAVVYDKDPLDDKDSDDDDGW